MSDCNPMKRLSFKTFFLLLLVWVFALCVIVPMGASLLCQSLTQSENKLVVALCGGRRRISWLTLGGFLAIWYNAPDTFRECRLPDLNPWDPSVLQYFMTYPPITCNSGPHVVYVEGDKIKVNKTEIALRLGSMARFKHCKFTKVSMVPNSDFVVRLSSEVVFKETIKIGKDSCSFLVECFDTSNKKIGQIPLFSVILPDERLEQEKRSLLSKHREENKVNESLSVLLLGIDGMSRSNMIRTMNLTRIYLLDKLHAIELRKFQKIGLNTFPNVMALLTGYEYEAFEKSHGWNFSVPLDVLNPYFIWSDFGNAGYRTAVSWDRRLVTAFHYQKKGWLKRYVDYNNRPTAIWTDKNHANDTVRGCVGNQTEIEAVTSYIVQLASVFNSSDTPYFGYVFLSRLTHNDPNQATKGDTAWRRVLSKFKDNRLLNNTLLIFFSDHGQRFGRLRIANAGVMESKNPMYFLVFPTWFKKKYPDLMKTVAKNQDRMVTHFDIHATLKDVLHFRGKNFLKQWSTFGISLFKEIPENRNCSSARVPIEYCSCLRAQKVKLHPEVNLALAEGLLEYINSKRDIHLCYNQTLKEIRSIMRLLQTETSLPAYQVLIVTEVKGLFEGVLTYSPGTGAKVVGDVYRLDLYKNQNSCVKDPVLQKFCTCKDRYHGGKF